MNNIVNGISGRGEVGWERKKERQMSDMIP